MKAILNKLFAQQKLNKQEAKDVLVNIANNKYNASQVAAFITVYLMRSISVEELSGFREALLDLCVKISFDSDNTIDLCGTGGDSKNTFNISTLSSFIVSGAGYKVTKHGNYGVSSTCGSSNLLESFGYQFTNDATILNRQLDKANICFLHAPLFHPAMKAVAPIRKDLGVKTFFNMLGPLVNPANPKNQLVGVFNLELARVYNYLLQETDKNYCIVHSLDGYDEISLTGDFKVITRENEHLYNPTNVKLNTYQESDLFGGDTVKEAANIFENILNGQGTKSQQDVVLVNAAFAINCFEKKSFEDCFEIAKSSLLNKKALKSFKTLISQ